jgi:predicted nucleotidyltransferase
MSKKTPRVPTRRSSPPSKSSDAGSTGATTPMPRDWWELLATLQRHRVRYLLIGGHAVSAHGTPRTTEDMDLLVERTLANGRRLRAALIEFGLGSLAPRAEEILETDTFWQFGRKPLRIDILTHIPAVTFASAWKRRVVVQVDDVEVPVLGLDDLIANKRAAGRAKDHVDADMLEAVRSLSKRR